MPKSNGDFIFTSNRDESPNRSTVLPTFYFENGERLLFPKDERSGGTWIGVRDNSRLVCLLNGGFIAHEPLGSYKMSRGLIVTSLLTTPNFPEAATNFDFNDIEPFTLICVDWSTELLVYELVWDGKDAHFLEKPLSPHIWSSSLLYRPDIIEAREQWFSNFLFESGQPTTEELLTFHKTAGVGDIDMDLIMDRGFVKTKSISQFSLAQNSGYFRYEDLQTKEISTTAL